MGGHEAGELASTSIVEHLKSIGIPSSAPDLRARFEDRVMIANREIRDISSARNGAVDRLDAGRAAGIRKPVCLHVGRRQPHLHVARRNNCRNCRATTPKSRNCSTEACFTARKRRTGHGATSSPAPSARVDDPPLDIAHGQIQPDDMFLICSDGLTAHVSDDEIARQLAGKIGGARPAQR